MAKSVIWVPNSTASGSALAYRNVTVAKALKTLGCFLLLFACAATPAIADFTLTYSGPTSGTVGQPFMGGFTAAGGTTPTTECFLPSTVTALPLPGVSLNMTACMITGTPTTAGTYPLTVDGANGSQTAQAHFTIVINPATTMTPEFIYNLPHWAAFGGWQTLWSIVDTSLAPNQCGLELMGPDGKPFSLATSAGTGSSIGPIPIAPWGTLEIVGGGPGGSTASGSSMVSCLGSANVSETYTFVDPSGIKQTAVSVLPTVPGSAAVFQANAFTGVAVWDSHPTKPLATTVYTYDVDGNLVGTATMSVPPLGKSSFNLNQVIQPTLPTNFVGSAQVVGDHNAMHVAVVGVQANGNGGFIAFNDPVISYSVPFTNYSGVYTIPNGQTGMVSINNLTPTGNGPDTTFFAGTVVSGSSSGLVNGIYNPRDGKLFLDFASINGPLSNASAALTQSSQSNFSGSIIGDPTVFHAPGTLTLNGTNETGFCWSDRTCSVKIGGDPVTKAQCKAVGGKSWSDPSNGCVAILGGQ